MRIEVVVVAVMTKVVVEAWKLNLQNWDDAFAVAAAVVVGRRCSQRSTSVNFSPA